MLVRILTALALAMTLSACGGGDKNAPVAAQRRLAAPCALAPDARAIFGREIAGVTLEPVDKIAGDCRWDGADGAIFAEIVIYTAGSTHNWRDETAEAFAARTLSSWSTLSFQAAAPIENTANAGQIVVNMPGGDATALLRKGDTIVFVLANSIDPRVTSETIAQRLTQSVAAHLQ